MTGWLFILGSIVGLGMVLGVLACRQRYDSPVLVVLLATLAMRAGYALDWARMALQSFDEFLCKWVHLRQQTAALPRVWRLIRVREVKGGECGEIEGPRRVQRRASAISVS